MTRRNSGTDVQKERSNKEGRHVGLDFYDLLIEGHYTQNARGSVSTVSPSNYQNGYPWYHRGETGFWGFRGRVPAAPRLQPKSLPRDSSDRETSSSLAGL